MSSCIIAIFVASNKHARQFAVDSVQVKAGKGIVGDRFFGLRQKQHGKNLTLIESEVIGEYNRHFKQSIPLSATRRNLITQGIHLNHLIGKTFKIGNTLCRGIELCEPCLVMARNFPGSILSQTDIINAFVNKGGIRAEVLADGILHVGDEIVMD